jgi:ATP-binding cassette subfamily B multidrug efflux pump
LIRGFLRLIRYCYPYRRIYIVGTVALVFVDLLDTFTPKLTQWVIDHLAAVLDGKSPVNPLVELLPAGWFTADALVGGVWVYGALLAIIVAITGFLRYVMSMSYARAGVTLIHNLRGRFFAHLQRLDAGYHDRTRVGDHMSLATNDTDACRMFFGIGMLLLLDTTIYFIMVPAYMLSISAKLMFASLITLPLIPLIVAKLTTTVEKRYEKVQAQFATLSGRAQESYSGAKVVKSFAREEAEVESFAKLARDYVRKSLSFARVYSAEMPLLASWWALRTWWWCSTAARS